LLANFAEPQLRFTNLGVELSSLNDVDIDSVLTVDLSEYIKLKKTFSEGSPASYEQLLFVSGVSHQIRPDSHFVSLNLEVNNAPVLVLGGGDFGKLDFNVLDY
jgi:hypothetical protein